MVASAFFIKELWDVTAEEKRSVVALLAALRDEAQIIAFPCYTQHHAIVLYIDLRASSPDNLITPERLARILRQEADRPVLKIMMRFLQRPAEYLMAWEAEFVKHYIEAADL